MTTVSSQVNSDSKQNVPEQSLVTQLLSLPFHPVILALFPVIYLVAKTRISLISMGFQPVLQIALGLIVVGIVTGLILRNLQKTCLLLSVLSLVYFIYGSLRIPFQQLDDADIALATNLCSPFYFNQLLSWMVVLSIIILVVLSFKLNESLVKNATVFLNVFALVIIVLNGSRLVKNEYRYLEDRAFEKQLVQTHRTALKNINESHEKDGNRAVSPSLNDLPDIYLIIPDGLTGSMSTAYGPNAIDDFVEALRERNFSVPEKCMSNYAATSNSVPSMLQMDYLHNVQCEPLKSLFEKTENGEVSLIYERRKDTNKANRKIAVLSKIPFLKFYLSSKGYEHVTAPDEDDLEKAQKDHNEFLAKIPDTAIGRTYLKRAIYNFASVDAVERLAEERHETPRFVFSHHGLPHPPFLMNEDGSFNSDYNENTDQSSLNATPMYYAQRRYTVNRLLKMVDHITKHSERDVVIVIVSGHAQNSFVLNDYGERFNPVGELNESLPYSVFRFANFIAILLPESKRCEIPHDLSNVNIFRIVLNQVFHERFPMLDNRHFMHIADDKRGGYYNFYENTKEVKKYLQEYDVAVEKLTLQQ